MKHGSLFSGIGGFDLAAQWMGWENVFQVEIDKFCNKVLEKNFPNVKRYGDIKEFDGTQYSGQLDILTGGFPCQPFSIAGNKQGNNDDRAIWYEMFRTIREVKPTYVVAENVPGLLSQFPMVFEQVCADLESEGYEVQPVIIPACAVNAWHRRDRIWFVAHAVNGKYSINGKEIGEPHSLQEINREKLYPWGTTGTTDDDTDDWSERNKGFLKEKVSQFRGIQGSKDIGVYADWNTRPDLFTPILCRSYDGIPSGMERVKSLGNSIVPQVAYEIFKAIKSVA